jgi:hypothetical protein
MASGIKEKYKIRPNLGPFSASMAKAVASVAVLALQNFQTGKNNLNYIDFKCPTLFFNPENLPYSMLCYKK